MTAAPCGRRRGPEAGVTLVEMLVALALFALVGLASFGVLDTVIRTRDRTEGRLEAVAALDRALILFGRDLGQSDPGSQVLDKGVLTFGLDGAGGPEEMGYALAGDALARRAGPEDSRVEQRLVAGVAALGWRALDDAGEWHEAWPPEARAPASLTQSEDGPADAALAGIEMRLTLAGDGTVSRLVELPAGVPE